MQKQVFESEIGESYVMAVHPSGLKIYILEKIILRTLIVFQAVWMVCLNIRNTLNLESLRG